MKTNHLKKYFECTYFGHGLLIERDPDGFFSIMKACLGSKGEKLPLGLRLKFAWKYLRGDTDISFDEVIFDDETAYELAREIIYQYLKKGEYVTIAKNQESK